MRVKALIIDNVKEDIIAIKNSLNQAGFDCEYTEAETGNIGLSKIKDNSPDIVILEVRLQGADGFELCKQIKKISSSIKILLVTRHNDAVDHEKAENAGADQHTVKTKSNKFLIAAFNEIVKQP